MWEVLCGKDGGGGNDKMLFIGLVLGVFEIVDVLGDLFGLLVETDHFRREIDQFTGVKATAGVLQVVKNAIAITLL